MNSKSLGCLLVGVFLIYVSGCAGIDVKEGKAITSVDLRAMQTREFDTTRKVAMKAVIEMFQDLGLTINEINDEYGIVSTKEGPLNFSPKTEGSVTLLGMYIPVPGGLSETGQGAANIEEIGDDRISIRVNFNKIASTTTTTADTTTPNLVDFLIGRRAQAKTTTSSATTAVTDENFYRVVFERIEKSIFLRENR